MNKDLEKIKENAILLLQLDPECSEACDLMDECQKEIIVAAERMATYIEHQKKMINNLGVEIARLKAELEKRPEVVRCGECKHKEWCRKSINKDGHGDMCPLSFCSAGQRRESEVRK